MTKEKTLAEKISYITGNIGAIEKEVKRDSTVKYAFRGIDDVMNRLNPMLAEQGITLQNKVLSYALTPRSYEKYNSYSKETEIKHSFYATVHIALVFSDGKETETWEEVAMSEDHSDKALTQAMSMAYKYAITRKFCILTKDLVDPDGLIPQRVTDQSPTPAPAHKPTIVTAPVANQNEIFDYIRTKVADFTKGSELRASMNDLLLEAKNKGLTNDNMTVLKAKIETKANQLINTNTNG